MKLTEVEINRAFRLFYGDKMKLGEIAKELDCSVYALSPWLYAPAVRIAREAIKEERAALAAARQEGGER